MSVRYEFEAHFRSLFRKRFQLAFQDAIRVLIQSTLYPILEWYFATKQVMSTRVQIQLLFRPTEHVLTSSTTSSMDLDHV